MGLLGSFCSPFCLSLASRWLKENDRSVVGAGQEPVFGDVWT